MKTKNVLLIEDCVLDAILIKESLEQNGKCCNINLLQNINEVAKHFDKILTNENSEIPDLIIANEELVIKDGVNLLSQIKNLTHFFIPVIIMTSSGPNCPPLYLDRHTCCFIKKPLDVKEFLAIIKEIKLYWLNLVN